MSPDNGHYRPHEHYLVGQDTSSGIAVATGSKQFGYNLDMRELLLTCLLATSACAQAGKFGSFTNSDDVGDPPLHGGAEFDATAGQYKITGSGTDIWAKADQFHYVWREMSGNFAVTATAKFLTDGIGHRKAVIMLRKSLDTDSPFTTWLSTATARPLFSSATLRPITPTQSIFR